MLSLAPGFGTVEEQLRVVVGTVGSADRSHFERHMGRWLARVHDYIVAVAEDCMDPRTGLEEHTLPAVPGLRLCQYKSTKFLERPLTFACLPVASLLL